jgi:hypothetical protein
MSKLVEQLREIGVINTHDLLRKFADVGKDVACSYSTSAARSVMCSRTTVFSPSHKTSPESAAWYDYGNKTFNGGRTDSLNAAMAWASEKYGITEWATCPTDRSAKIPAYVLTRAKEALKEKRAA